MDDQRTASELSLMSSASKRRYGKIAKQRERAYKMFWRIWYDTNLYFWDNTVEKMISISGIYGASWRTIRKADITLKGDLDIKIESKSQSDQKKQIRVNSLLQFHQLASASPNYQIAQ